MVNHMYVSTPSSQTLAVRHSGRANVRGKLRRVWRTRFLKLFDNGILRYYIQDEENESNTMQLRYTLSILHARIMDVTTLRDMHSGLPRGMFGFAFKGQRLQYLENASQQSISLTSGICTPMEPVQEPREYLCAVPSLDEAQMWVVALQWAATQHLIKHPIYPLPTTVGPASSSKPIESDSPIIHAEEAGMKATLTLPTLMGQRATSGNSPLPQPTRQQTPSLTVHNMFVTKVTGYRLSRITGLQFEIAYEINVLLLRPQNTLEWKVFRTSSELEELLQKMREKVIPPGKRDALPIQDVRNLPRLAHTNCTPSAVLSSVTTVDHILRTLLLDLDTINMRELQEFLLVRLPAHQNGMAKSKLGYYQRTVSEVTSINQQKCLSNDEYVKAWIQKYSKQNQTLSIFDHSLTLAQYPVLCVGVVGACVILLGRLARIYHHLVPIIPIRLDILLISWIAAYYVGGQQIWQTSRYLSSTRSFRSAATEVRETHRDLEHDIEVQDEDDESSTIMCESDEESRIEENAQSLSRLPSPLPKQSNSDDVSCWSEPDSTIFFVRGPNYLNDRVKVPSNEAPMSCLGVDVWLTDHPPRHIARHPAMLGGKVNQQDVFLVNFLLPFGNLVAYFSMPPLHLFPPKVRKVWCDFLKGDQQYRDARLKLLPVVINGPWIVKAAVGPGKSPAVLGKVIPLQYFFREASGEEKAIYEVDVIITASSVARGILSVVKGHTKSVSIGFAFIIEATQASDLPETVLARFSVNALDLEHCPYLPEHNLE